MNFDFFVIPFCIGLIAFPLSLILIYSRWIIAFDNSDRIKILSGMFTHKSILALKEVVAESLLHFKIFRANFLLGFMHSSLAFGWLMMILIATIESKLHSHRMFNMPYDPIFLKYFTHNKTEIPDTSFFITIMDSMLLLVLSGILLAFIKRRYSRLFGMKNATKLKLHDKLALYSLWLIFPLRLLAESSTAAIWANGGFLTNNVGHVLSLIVNPEIIEKPFWWGYSSVLGIFFVFLPFSRYMHIPTEVVLIFLRHYGLKSKKHGDAMSGFEVFSCPRCGICIDKCQLATSTDIKNIQSVYMLYNIRNNKTDQSIIENCLVCGRCTEYCPIGIDLNRYRLQERHRNTTPINNYAYLKPKAKQEANIGYFAGCMTHLTPTIIKSLKTIFDKAEIQYNFLDINGSICCGRPLKLSGFFEDAEKIKMKNIELIEQSKITKLVTSCPICLKTFTEDYKLNIPVVHHTQYLLELVTQQRLKPVATNKKVTYHDPCELGRGLNIYKEPRELITQIAKLQDTKSDKHASLCCGSSLANNTLTQQQKNKIAHQTATNLTESNPDYVITSCPLCKKTIANSTETKVMDISELLSQSL